MSDRPFPPSPESRLALRLLFVFVLGLLMLVPLDSVRGLVRDRGERYQGVLTDLAATWGREQVLQGPLLVVPWWEARRTAPLDPETGEPLPFDPQDGVLRHAVFLPDALDLQVDLQPEPRHRGIYEVLVYTAEATIRGSFGPLEIPADGARVGRVDWDRAFLVLGLSDVSALARLDPLRWGEASAEAEPGIGLSELLPSGLHVPLPGLVGPGQHPFELALGLRGSGGLRFAPTARTTDVTVRSPWPHPSFQGSPLESRLDGEGFVARWSVSYLTRSYPQRWTVEFGPQALGEGLAGVDLFRPVALYDQVERAVHYGLLFVFLTFGVLVLVELLGGPRVHFVQYGLVGLALCLFYLTLLAVSEHAGFGRGYVAATAAVVGMITGYAAAALRSLRRAGLLGALLLGLYAVLFAILRMEDYALLAGTAVLLVATAALMFATRRLGAAQG